MESKSGKRVVSRGEYAQVQTDRAFMGTPGIVFWICAFFAGLLMAACLIAMCFCLAEASPGAAGGCLLAGFLLALLSCECVRMGSEAMQLVKAMHPSVLLNRTNTADVPASDSLLRASSEPERKQQSVLLRAAAEGRETPSEQLVRAAARGSKGE